MHISAYSGIEDRSLNQYFRTALEFSTELSGISRAPTYYSILLRVKLKDFLSLAFLCLKYCGRQSRR